MAARPAAPSRRKTSFEVDFAKVDAAREALGTKTLTDTVDAALTEVLLVRRRRTLLDLLSTPGATDALDVDAMASAWR